MGDKPASTVFSGFVNANKEAVGAIPSGEVSLARLSRPVKEMIGGIEGWKDEGFELAT